MRTKLNPKFTQHYHMSKNVFKSKGAKPLPKKRNGMPFHLGQIIRNKVTGDHMTVTSIHGDIVRCEPIVICHYIGRAGWDGWEAVYK